MRHKDTIRLVSVTYKTDDIGNQIPERAEREIFANRQSVGMNEYYQASSQGLKPELEFKVYSFEYGDESALKHDGALYQIIRVKREGENTRITCQRDAGDG